MPDPAPVPLHDWPRVGGFWHTFDVLWVGEIYRQLNARVLPPGYYAEAEPQGGFTIEEADGDEDAADEMSADESPPRRFEEDVVTLREAGADSGGGLLMADAPPQVRVRTEFVAAPPGARRVAVKRDRDDRTVALIELASPGNRDGRAKVRAFCEKVEAALRAKVHVLLIDLFPPNRRLPGGLHGEIAERFGTDYAVPPGEPLCCASYRAAGTVTSFVEPLAVGAAPPTMPLFLTADRYVNLPLAHSYAAAFAPTPAKYRRMLDAAGAPSDSAARGRLTPPPPAGGGTLPAWPSPPRPWTTGPVWTLGTFHDFHQRWMTHLTEGA